MLDGLPKMPKCQFCNNENPMYLYREVIIKKTLASEASEQIKSIEIRCANCGGIISVIPRA